VNPKALLALAEAVNQVCGEHDLTIGQAVAALTVMRMNAIAQLDTLDARNIIRVAHKMEQAVFDPLVYNATSLMAGKRVSA
jgi:hypothetical protein